MAGIIHIIIQVLTQRHERQSCGCDRSVDGGGSATRCELDPNLEHSEWEKCIRKTECFYFFFSIEY